MYYFPVWFWRPGISLDVKVLKQFDGFPGVKAFSTREARRLEEGARDGLAGAAAPATPFNQGQQQVRS